MLFEEKSIRREQEIVTKGRLPTSGTLMFQKSKIDLSGDHGRIKTDIVRFEDLDLALGRVNSTGHEIALEDSENVTLLLPRRGRLDIRIGARDYRLASGALHVFRPTQRLTKANPIGWGTFLAHTLQVPMRRVRGLEDRLELRRGRGLPSDAVDLPGVVGRYLRDTLAPLVDDLIALPSLALPGPAIAEIGHLIDEQLCDIFGLGMEPSASRRLLPALNRVRLAQEIMHAQSDQPLSMLDLAQELGVSMRSLQLAFQEIYGQGPREILTSIRLKKARLSLLAANGDDRVTVIALDCGFSHLGRFSQAYAQAFGERPSDTLARRRA